MKQYPNQKHKYVSDLFFLTRWTRNNQCPLVECFHNLLESTQCFHEFYLHLIDKICAVSLESTMWFFVQNNNDISRFQAWFLVTLTTEADLLSISHTWNTQELSVQRQQSSWAWYCGVSARNLIMLLLYFALASTTCIHSKAEKSENIWKQCRRQYDTKVYKYILN